MKRKYKIYFGLLGKYNTYGCRDVEECESQDEAEQFAYECAVAEYESFDVPQDQGETFENEEEANDFMQDWIEFSAIPVDSDDSSL